MVGLRVREAGPEDLDQIAACGVRFAAESGIPQFLPRTAAEIKAGVERMMALPQVKVWLAEQGGEVVGGLGMIYGPALWKVDDLHADELFFWVAPEAPPTTALRLLKMAEQDMRKSGVDTRTFYELPGSPEKVGRLYERMGMVRAQVAYVGLV